jgi:hypothetical protein
MLKMFLGQDINNPLKCSDFSEIQNGTIKFDKVLQFTISKDYDHQFLRWAVGGADMTSCVCFCLLKHYTTVKIKTVIHGFTILST